MLFYTQANSVWAQVLENMEFWSTVLRINTHNNKTRRMSFTRTETPKKDTEMPKKRYINIRHAKKRCKYDAPPILLVGLYTPQSATPVAAPRRHGSGLSAPGSGPRGCPDFRRIYDTNTIHIYYTYILSTIYIYYYYYCYYYYYYYCVRTILFMYCIYNTYTKDILYV